MTQERKDLIDEFDKWLDINPIRILVNLQCAIIAEKYAKEQVIKELERMSDILLLENEHKPVDRRIEELKQQN